MNERDQSGRRDAAGGPGASETREWRVRGRVQGVAFRATTRERARQLGLSGLAENLPDGRVRVVARGRSDALDRLAGWLRHGPPHARVDGLERIEPDPEAAPGLVDGEFATR